MNDLLLGKSCHRKTSCHTLSPEIHITLCVGCKCQFSRRSGSSLYSRYLRFRNCQKSKRIVFSQILFRCKWKFIDIFHSFDISRFYSKRFHLLVVKRNIFIYPFHQFYQSFTLQSRHLIPAHTFHFRISDPFLPLHRTSSPL